MPTELTRRTCLEDPDPVVVDLLVNLTATGLAGIVVKVARRAWNARPLRAEALDNMAISHDEIGQLRGLISELEEIVGQAETLVSPGTRRELGGVLLLDRQSLAEYERLREELFERLRIIDAINRRQPPPQPSTRGRSRSKSLPREFRDLVSVADRRLRDSRSATLSGVALAEVRTALVAMRGLLDLLSDPETV